MVANISLGLTEAEALDLSGYEVDVLGAPLSGGAAIKALSSSEGTASGVFTGPAGNYFIDVSWLNENDGQSPFGVRIDGVTVASWTGSGGSNALETERVAVSLDGGEVIELYGRKNVGEFARFDAITISVDDGAGDPPPPPPPPPPPADAAEIGLGLTEAEALDLSGYEVDALGTPFSGGAAIKALSSSEGTASGVFTGPAGNYFIDVSWLNENDGQSPFGVRIDGVTVASWTGSGGSNALETERVAVSLNGGEVIELYGRKNVGEFARFDAITISVDDGAGDPPPPPPPPPPPADAAEIGLGLTEAEALDLSGYEVDALGTPFSGGAAIKALSSSEGTASGVFTGPAGNYFIDVSWLNENDGQSPFGVRIDGVTVASWTGSGGSNALETERVAVSLNGGEVIELYGRKNVGEFARFDAITISVDDGAGDPPPPPPPPPPADAAEIGLGLTEAEALDLTGYEVDALGTPFSGGAAIKALSSSEGTASGVFTGPAGNYFIDVSWLNENDGQSPFGVRIDGVTVASWTGSGGSNALETERVAVSLNGGEVIELYGRKNVGEFARFDAITISVDDGAGDPPPPPPPPPPADAAEIGLGLTEAEALDLTGYEVDALGTPFSGGAAIKALSSSEGTASGVFTGPAGNYFIDVSWLNENDGQSPFGVRIDGVTVASWTGSGGSNALETERVAVSLNGGEVIELYGRKNVGEFARFDAITISVDDGAGDPPPPPPPPPPPADAAEIGLGLTEAEALDLSGYEVDALGTPFSGGAVIKVLEGGEGTASGVFTGPDGNYIIDVAWLNENDGESDFGLRVNGNTVTTWKGLGGSNSAASQKIAVSLATGDQIELFGRKDIGEFARFDAITISVDDGTPPSPLEDAFDFIAFAGQSNAEGHFFRRDGDASPGPLGADAFEDRMAVLTGVETTAIEAARAGSASNEAPDPVKYWWNLANDEPGPSLLEAVQTIRASIPQGRDLDAIIWAQGEDDVGLIERTGADPTETANRLTIATTKTFEYLRAEFGDVPIFIQKLGDFPNYASFDDFQVIRDAQDDLINDLSYVYDGATTIGVEAFDDIHFSVDGYNDIAVDLANSVFNVLGDEFVFT